MEAEKRAALAAWLRELYEQAGWQTQAECAADVGVTPGEINFWLNADKPPPAPGSRRRGIGGYNVMRFVQAVERRRAARGPLPLEAAALRPQVERVTQELLTLRDLLNVQAEEGQS